LQGSKSEAVKKPVEVLKIEDHVMGKKVVENFHIFA
jgi:hypothetical protein